MNERTRIMNMRPGPEMDKEITAMIEHISGEKRYVLPFTTDPVSALELWQFVSLAFGSVALVKLTGAPQMIGEFCGIKDDEDEETYVYVMTGDWMESLAKASLLYHKGLFGESVNPDYEMIMKEAPFRFPH